MRRAARALTSCIEEYGWVLWRQVAFSRSSVRFAALTVGPFDGFSFTGQVSRGFRDPTLSDRFYRGPSGRGFITGNPDLEPETSLQIDLGARYATERLRANVYVYQYRITDLVERFTTATDFFFFRNRGKAQYRGVEVEAQADLGQASRWSSRPDRSRTRPRRRREANDELWLDDVAPNMAAGASAKAARKGSATCAWQHSPADNRPDQRDHAPGYTLLDAGASWWLTRTSNSRQRPKPAQPDVLRQPGSAFVFAPGGARR